MIDAGAGLGDITFSAVPLPSAPFSSHLSQIFYLYSNYIPKCIVMIRGPRFFAVPDEMIFSNRRLLTAPRLVAPLRLLQTGARLLPRATMTSLRGMAFSRLHRPR